MYFFSPPDFNDLRRDIVMISIITMEGISKNFKDGHSGWGVLP